MPNGNISDVIELGDEFYIRAQSSLADDRTRVLLDGNTFAIFDRYGDIQPVGFGQQGLFCHDTRYLSRLELRICGQRPLLLSSAVRDDNVLLAIDLTNPDLQIPSGQTIPKGTVHIHRVKYLLDGRCFEEAVLHNYSDRPVDVDLEVAFGADFADIFEVRGQKRARRGADLPADKRSTGTVLSYRGLDGIVRRTIIQCTATSVASAESAVTVPVHLEPHEETIIRLTIVCEQDGNGRRSPLTYEEGFALLKNERALSPLSGVDFYTSNEQVNDWLNRSLADLTMLTTATPFGPYPYAGVPWFSTVFGRDGLITAAEVLWLVPELAKGVLGYLAATQACHRDPELDAEPGKILHEVRSGEMAQLREVPFGRYYGSVDSTPLFVMLAGSYYERTGDLDFLRSMWPNILAALEWIDRFGDVDGDGFVEYARQSGHGLIQQGWKDSHDSVVHADGRIAPPPIALCEVQGYVYAAKSTIAGVADDLGYPELASKLRGEAEQLKKKFNDEFWCDDLSMYALALDGEKHQCRVRSSNAGQCLFSGIANPVRLVSTIESLLSGSMFSGWGVRTLATVEKRYNPMSYHNGSVWPHDNALIAAGVAAFRDKRLATRILSGLLDLSVFTELHRLPELICGFARENGKGPTLYPVACSPQAWAAGSAFLVLQSCLGLSIRAKEARVYIYYPALPESVQFVRIRNLKVGHATLDLMFERHTHAVSVDIERRCGQVEIVAIK
jgi:glycogen debranching enzyme